MSSLEQPKCLSTPGEIFCSPLPSEGPLFAFLTRCAIEFLHVSLYTPPTCTPHTQNNVFLLSLSQRTPALGAHVHGLPL